jgi:hypothetical protein
MAVYEPPGRILFPKKVTFFIAPILVRMASFLTPRCRFFLMRGFFLRHEQICACVDWISVTEVHFLYHDRSHIYLDNIFPFIYLVC